MTVSTAHQTIPAANVTGLRDPILQELWAIKAQINAQANYSVEEIVRRLKQRQNEPKESLNNPHEVMKNTKVT